jgi:hypothetical protein
VSFAYTTSVSQEKDDGGGVVAGGSRDAPPLKELAVFAQRLYVHAGPGDHPLQRALQQSARTRGTNAKIEVV